MVVATQLVDVEASCSTTESDSGNTASDDTFDSSFIDDQSYEEDMVYAPVASLPCLTQTIETDAIAKLQLLIERVEKLEQIVQSTFDAVKKIKSSKRSRKEKARQVKKERKLRRVESSQVDSA